MSQEDGLVKQLSLLPKYGLIGVMLSLILLSAFGMWQTYKVSTKYIDSSTQTFTKTVQENTQVLSGLKTVIELKIK